jgi:hypothetical protein
VRQQLETLLLAAFVDGAQNVQQLTTDWGVASERDAAKFLAEGVGGAVSCHVYEAVFEHAVGVVIDANMGVPLRCRSAGGSHTGSAIGNRIAVEPDRSAAAVAQVLTLAAFG